MPPHLMGTSEIATYLQVSKQRVVQLAALEDFPEPTARLAAGRVWNTADVVRWARTMGRAK